MTGKCGPRMTGEKSAGDSDRRHAVTRPTYLHSQVLDQNDRSAGKPAQSRNEEKE